MGNDIMDLEELATYLQRDVREVSKMASRGYLPGHKVGGSGASAASRSTTGSKRSCRLHRAAAHRRRGGRDRDGERAAPGRLPVRGGVAVPLAATTRASVLRELVALAEQSWQVYDPEAVLEAIRQREEMGSTALPTGVAIPHPHRPLPNALGEAVIAFGRTASGIPFGGRARRADGPVSSWCPAATTAPTCACWPGCRGCCCAPGSWRSCGPPRRRATPTR